MNNRGKRAPFRSLTGYRSHPARESALSLDDVRQIASLELEVLHVIRGIHGSHLPGLRRTCDMPGGPEACAPVQCAKKDMSDWKLAQQSRTAFGTRGCLDHAALRQLNKADSEALLTILCRYLDTLPVEILQFILDQASAFIRNDCLKICSTDAYGTRQLCIRAVEDIPRCSKILGMDMLLIELYGVSTHDDLEAAGIRDISIAEFEGRWFLGLWAGRLSNHACQSNAAFTYDVRPKYHTVRCGVYVQNCSTKDGHIEAGDEITVNYGSDYFGPDNQDCMCPSRWHAGRRDDRLKPNANIATVNVGELLSREPSPHSVVEGVASRIGDDETAKAVSSTQQTSETPGQSAREPRHSETIEQASIQHAVAACDLSLSSVIGTPFSTVPSLDANSEPSRWSRRPASYKVKHIKAKAQMRQNKRGAIRLLVMPLPSELQGPSIRPLREAIHKIEWWTRRGRYEGTSETDAIGRLETYREIEETWTELLRG